MLALDFLCVALAWGVLTLGGAVALLGDRIRLTDHFLDPGVFIRSLATRGSLGGLSRATGDCIRVMDAMGKDVVVVETVGVGQDEIDIVRAADTVAVVLVPGMGDDIQAIKAGILEIAGPQRAPFNDIVARYLEAVGDPFGHARRAVVVRRLREQFHTLGLHLGRGNAIQQGRRE